MNAKYPNPSVRAPSSIRKVSLNSMNPFYKNDVIVRPYEQDRFRGRVRAKFRLIVEVISHLVRPLS